MIIGIDGSRAFVTQRTGVENYSWHLIHELSRLTSSSSNLKLVLYLRPGQKPDFKLPSNWQVKTIPYRRFFTQIGLACQVILHPPAVLFIPAHTLPLLAKLLRPRTKIIVTIHGWEASFLPTAYALRSRLWLAESTRWAVLLADHIIAVSQSTEKHLIQKLHCPQGKITVIPEGVDIQKFQTSKLKSQTKKIKQKYHIQNDYLLFVGTLQPRKNLNRLIKAFAKIRKIRPSLSLVIVGKKGWDYRSTLALPRKLKIEKHVKFLHYVPDSDLPLLYQSAQVFCFPSLAEGFGLPVLEAMAAKVPVVTSTTTSLPEVAGSAAILVNPYSVVAIAAGLQFALGLPAKKSGGVRLPRDLKSFASPQLKVKAGLSPRKLPRELIKRGQQQAAKFSWKSTADKTLKILMQSVV